MVAATKKRKGRSNRGRAKRVPGWEREVLLEKGHGLMSRLSDAELLAAIPVLERYAEDPTGVPAPPSAPPDPGRRMVELGEFAKMLDLVDDLMHSYVSDVESCCCGDVAIFIWNNGDHIDSTEALLALEPIARRVKARVDAGTAKRMADAEAASK